MLREHLTELSDLARRIHTETGRGPHFTATVDAEMYERICAELGHMAIDKSSDGTPVALVYPRSVAVGPYVVVRPREDNRITRPIGG